MGRTTPSLHFDLRGEINQKKTGTKRFLINSGADSTLGHVDMVRSE